MAHPFARIAPFLGLTALVSGCPDSHGTDAGMACRCDVGGPDVAVPDSPPSPTDVPAPPDTPERDAGPVDCSAQDARAEVCPASVCDGLDNYAWDGERCIFIACGTCQGADCEGLPTTREECQRAHASCDSALCTATGGDWQFWAEECGHHECGFPVPSVCIVGMPVCNCGYDRSFVPGVGCATDSCPRVDPLPPETLCGSTGGTWTNGICCATTCGVPCGDDCAAPACVCGPFQIFDPIRGCINATECYERAEGQTCTNIASRCEEGLLCCRTCTGAGCSPDSECRAPLCDSNPDIDECGNNLLSP